MDKTKITLVSSDGVKFTTSLKALYYCEQFRGTQQILSPTQPIIDEEQVLDLHSVELKEIVEYINYHQNDDDSASSNTEDAQKWDEEFIRRVTKDRNQHLRLLVAADRLTITPLFKMLDRELISQMPNKSLDDLNEEQKMMLKNQYPWLLPKK
ncbi:MAG: hypothetical protein EZS28_013251 [Streblomastix strix]|uniref:SKP1 component POZ domain-containing protein n=1 Tax=Streblomastix strix TaxID=222440 RepID=A0A5J4WA14_9EUKA|nr:MAG: hypothetical protein EZS28_013251 [Streblomastix strix]